MTPTEVQRLKEQHPSAFAVWEDRMFESSHRVLIDNLLAFVPMPMMERIMKTIEKEIDYERRQETE